MQHTRNTKHEMFNTVLLFQNTKYSGSAGGCGLWSLTSRPLPRHSAAEDALCSVINSKHVY